MLILPEKKDCSNRALELKHYHYLAISVAISVLAHLILLGFLSETYFQQKEIPHVFNVDLVAPPVAEKNVPQVVTPPRVIKKIRKETPLKYQKSPKSVLLTKPETMLGDGDSNKVSKDVTESTTVEKAEAGSENKTTTVDTSSKTEKKGPYLAGEISLHDRAKIEKRGEGVSSERKVIPFDTTDLRFRGFMGRLKAKIEGVWKYPEEAAREGRSGELDIRFVIKRDGTLGDVKTIGQSGFRDLDNAAEQAIKDSFPFEPLSNEWEGDEYTVDGHFIYVLGGKYVR